MGSGVADGLIMLHGMKLISPPAVQPITLDEAKLHVRVDHTDDDAVIARAIAAAVGYVDGSEGFLGRALVDQTWELSLTAFPTGQQAAIKIPLPPLIEVLSVKYDNSGGTESTVPASDYVVDNAREPGRIVTKSAWPVASTTLANAVRIRYRAGYQDRSMSPPVGTVPVDILNAMLLIVGDLYDNRANIVIGQSAITMPAADVLLRRRLIDMSLA